MNKTYYGYGSPLELDEKWTDILEEMDRKELKQEYKEHRNRVDLDYILSVEEQFDLLGDEEKREQLKLEEILAITDSLDELLDDIEKDDREKHIGMAIKTLTKDQQELLFKIFYERETQAHVAKKESVSRTAINRRLKRIYKDLEDLIDF